jgi:hypothetical protein
LDEFKDLVADMPTTDLRVGYQATTAPPVLEPGTEKGYVVQDRRQRPPLQQQRRT